MSWLEALGWKPKQDPAAGGDSAAALRKIISALDELEPPRARYLATFSYILSRVANADLDISREETREMERIVEGIGGIPEDQAVLTVQLAKQHSQLFGGTDNFSITEEFNRLASREQKIALLSCLFAVSASDQSISTIEDNEIRTIARELRLDHSDFISARSTYTQYLEVLKKKE